MKLELLYGYGKGSLTNSDSKKYKSLFCGILHNLVSLSWLLKLSECISEEQRSRAEETVTF